MEIGNRNNIVIDASVSTRELADIPETPSSAEGANPPWLEDGISLEKQTSPRNSTGKFENAKTKLSALHRFKQGANNVIAAQKFLPKRRTTLSKAPKIIGGNPGVDFNDPAFGLEDIESDCVINICDYNEFHMESRVVRKSELADFLNQPRPKFSKVRWISVQGLDYNVMKELSSVYNIHPLSMEDIFHDSLRVKVDYFENHIYTSLLLLSVGLHSSVKERKVTEEHRGQLYETLGRGKYRQFNTPDDHEVVNVKHDECSGSTLAQQSSSSVSHHKGKRKHHFNHTTRAATWIAQDQMDIIKRLELQVEQANFLLMNDGTVISVFPDNYNEGGGDQIINPILARLSERSDTNLLRHQDSSFLFYALIDVLVDLYIPISECYRHEIDSLQDVVMLSPKAAYTKTLHLIGQELGTLRAQINPTLPVIDSLLNEDVGKVSKLTKVYLKDVLDHITQVQGDLDLQKEEAHELIDFIFNMTSHATNQSMKTLSILGAFFMPTTFLAGVYGMNFEVFPEIKDMDHFPYGNVAWFWFLCVCILAICFTLMAYGGLVNTKGMLARWKRRI